VDAVRPREPGQLHVVVDGEEGAAAGADLTQILGQREELFRGALFTQLHDVHPAADGGLDAGGEVGPGIRDQDEPRSLYGFPGHHEAIRRGGHASVSRRLEKWRRGSVCGSATPICSVIASDSISSSACCRSQGWWWMSPR
jgi:hypothetical protein